MSFFIKADNDFFSLFTDSLVEIYHDNPSKRIGNAFAYVQDARRPRLGCSRQRAVRAVRQKRSFCPKGE